MLSLFFLSDFRVFLKTEKKIFAKVYAPQIKLFFVPLANVYA